MNIKVPKQWDIDGQSFLPQIREKKVSIANGYSVIMIQDLTRPRVKCKQFFRDMRYKLYSNGNFYDTIKDPKETNPIARVKEMPKLKIKKKTRKTLCNIPAWKVGDPAIPMCILPEFPLLQTPKT